MKLLNNGSVRFLFRMYSVVVLGTHCVIHNFSCSELLFQSDIFQLKENNRKILSDSDRVYEYTIMLYIQTKMGG